MTGRVAGAARNLCTGAMTLRTAARTTARTARSVPALVCASALALTLAGCSSDSALDSVSNSFALRNDDPSGYLACRNVGLLGSGTEADREELMAKAAAAAAAAQTPQIRRTVTPSVEDIPRERLSPGGIGRFSAAEADLRTACEESGFDFASQRQWVELSADDEPFADPAG